MSASTGQLTASHDMTARHRVILAVAAGLATVVAWGCGGASDDAASAQQTSTTIDQVAQVGTASREPLVDGLVLLDDLPDGYVANVESQPFLNRQTNEVGRYSIELCNGALEVQAAADGRYSTFSYPTASLGYPKDGVVEEISSTIRLAIDGATFDTATVLAAAAEPCIGQSFGHPAGTAVVAAVETAGDDEVDGVGIQLVFTDGDFVGRSFLIYVLEAGRVDGYLFMSGVAEPLDQLPTLAQPIVAAARDRLASCKNDIDVCAP